MTIDEGATLAQTLRGWADPALAELLRARPDLVTPVPVDVSGLADRACTRASVARALDRLDRAQLTALAASTLLARPRTAAAVAHAAGMDGARSESARATFERLRALGLLWGEDTDLQVPAACQPLLGPTVGLGRAVHELLFEYAPRRLTQLAADIGADLGADPPRETRSLVAAVTAELTKPGRIAELLAEAGPNAVAAARQLAGAAGAIGRLPEPDRQPTAATARTGLDALLARGLLVATGTHTVVLPGEVGWVLRDERMVGDASVLVEPEIRGPSRTPAIVDRAASGAALEVVARVEHLLEIWSRTPAVSLRGGGVGVRELRRTAAELDVDDRLAALLMEVTAAAGLVAESDDDEAEWLPTVDADAWLGQSLAARWALLATAWLTTPRTASLAGTRDDRGRTRAALSVETERPASPDLRRTVLSIVGSLEPGRCPDVDDVAGYLGWLRPRRMGTGQAGSAAVVALSEAGQLGVLGLGGLSSAGRALLDGGDPARVMARLLPDAASTVTLQGDLTAIAPGPLEPALGRTLRMIADVESRGSATTYRFSPESVRRGLDAGLAASEIITFLQQHSATPVPQPLTYLVTDTARRHGTLRLGRAGTYLRSEDPADIATILADPRAQHLGLRPLADTVALSPYPPEVVLDGLRELGLAPVAEGSDGAMLNTTEPRVRRAPRVSSRSTFRLEARDVDQAVRALRAGDAARSARPDTGSGTLGRAGSPAIVDSLAAAIRDRAPVWLGYLDRLGAAHDRVVTPLRIEGGQLAAFDSVREAPAEFSLHRITGVARVDHPV